MVSVRIGHRLLGRHVHRRAQSDSGGRQRGTADSVRERLSNTEIRYQGMPAREQHVGRLDVAMDHALGVRVGQRIDYIAKYPHGIGHRQLALAGQSLAQRLALHERHGVIEEVVG
jgi:hypothetical protein